jgi:hypothetical protein
MSDIRNHKVAWVVGYVYVGNGTLGATDSVYFVTNDKLNVVVAGSTSGNFGVPLLMGDTVFGTAYARDIAKHYARMHIRSARVHLISQLPSTSNSMTAVIAPYRGGGNIGDASTGTGAAADYGNVLSVSGSKNLASWESGSLDLTPYLAGGSGSDQREFQIYHAATSLDNSASGAQLVPATFLISGTNGTDALRGKATHAIIIEEVVDFLDYIGGATGLYPIALKSYDTKARSFDALRKERAAEEKKQLSTSSSSSSSTRLDLPLTSSTSSIPRESSLKDYVQVSQGEEFEDRVLKDSAPQKNSSTPSGSFRFDRR